MTLKTRKTALLAAIAILLVVYVVQILASNKSTEKIFKLKDEITTIIVETAAASNENAILSLKKNGDDWVAGKKAVLASKEDVDAMIENLKEIKAVTTVSRTTNEVTDERYGFSSGECFTVIANNGDKTLRSITVGKASPTGEQYYFKIDNGNDVYLSAKNLKELFYTTNDEIREVNIYDFESSKIKEIALTNNSGVFKLKRNASMPNAPWETDAAIEENMMLSQSKVNTLVLKLKTVQAEKWNDGKEDFSPDAILTVRCGDETVTLQAKKNEENFVAVTNNYSDSFNISERTFTALETKFEDLLEEKSVVQETQNLN